MHNFSADARMIEAYNQERILREAEAYRQLKVEGSVDDREIRNYRFTVGGVIEALRVFRKKLQYSGSA